MRVIAHTIRGGRGGGRREQSRAEQSRGEFGRNDGAEEGGSGAEVEVEVPSFPFNAPLQTKRRMILL